MLHHLPPFKSLLAHGFPIGTLRTVHNSIMSFQIQSQRQFFHSAPSRCRIIAKAGLLLALHGLRPVVVRLRCWARSGVDTATRAGIAVSAGARLGGWKNVLDRSSGRSNLCGQLRRHRRPVACLRPKPATRYRSRSSARRTSCIEHLGVDPELATYSVSRMVSTQKRWSLIPLRSPAHMVRRA